MELASILNYVHDSIRHNQEKLDQLKDYCKKNPAKSVQAKKIHGKIYYCLMYREGRQVKQDYLGSQEKVDQQKARREIEAYNKKLREIKKKYKDLQVRNEKLKRILKFAERLNNEN
ncbi:MAG: hypothetical protein L6428_14285 [Candidatus Aminicenantes bacterium]|nr:hypothetical protein [Candidatus Aminicenantes bacterium]